MDKKLIPNSTQIPNIVLDILIPDLPDAEGRCLLYICRRTYGFHKDEDHISFSQFINGIKGKLSGEILDLGTGKSRDSVNRALSNLKEAGAIFVRKEGEGRGTQCFYRINLAMDCAAVIKKVKELRKKDREKLPIQPRLKGLVRKSDQKKRSENQTSIGQKNEPVLVRKSDLQNKGKQRETKVSEQSSPIHLLRTYFIGRCKELKGYEPEMAFSKEGGLLKEKLKRFSVDQLKDLINKFLNSKIGEDLGYTLSICLSAGVINQWLAGKLEKAKKPYFQGNPMRKMFNKWQVLVNGDWLEFAGTLSEIIYK